MKLPNLDYKVKTAAFNMDNQISALTVRAFSRAVLLDFEVAMLGVLKFAETEEYRIENDIPIRARNESITLATKLHKQFKASGAISILSEPTKLVFGTGQKGYLVMVTFTFYNRDYVIFSISDDNISSVKNMEFENSIYQKYNYEYGIHNPVTAYSDTLKRKITAIPY